MDQEIQDPDPEKLIPDPGCGVTTTKIFSPDWYISSQTSLGGGPTALVLSPILTTRLLVGKDPRPRPRPRPRVGGGGVGGGGVRGGSVRGGGVAGGSVGGGGVRGGSSNMSATEAVGL